MDYAIVSEKGDRQINEDSAAAVECDGNMLFVLADGLGGHGHGEVASGIVTETARAVLSEKKCGFEELDNLIETVIEDAQAKLFERQEKDSDSSSYKTTAVLLAVNEQMVRWGYIGDSRLYYFRKNRIEQVALHIILRPFVFIHQSLGGESFFLLLADVLVMSGDEQHPGTIERRNID